MSELVTNTSAASEVTNPGPAVVKGLGRDINNYLNVYVNHTDDKARGIATLNTVALGVVMAWHKAGVLEPAHLAAMACFVVGAALSALVILPRTPHPRHGLIFWEDIRGYNSSDAYRSAVLEQNEQDVERNYAYQNYYVSRVLHTKNQLLRLSMIATALGVAAAMVDYWLV